MLTCFLPVVKAILNITLAAIFWIIFGRISVDRFQKQNVLVSSSTIPPNQEGLEMPAFTICKRLNSTSLGWKGARNPNITSVKEVLAHKCGGAQNVTRCIEEGTFGRDDIHAPSRQQRHGNLSLTDFLSWAFQFLII